VLAGGRSRRFGSHKALAEFGGEALWRRAVRVLADAGLPVLVVANAPEVVTEVTVPVRPDARPGRGPLAGIETGLLEAADRGKHGIVVLACDLVRVESVLIRQLVARWSGTGVTAFEAPGPWSAEPLCATWGLDLLPAVTEALDSGRGSPGALLASVPTELVTPGGLPPGQARERVFRSANRPADLADEDLT
jgi:molybdopterin-guanine dinucleotide biosynthesis protein A